MADYRKSDSSSGLQHGRVKNTSVALLSTGHACVDVYQGTVAALVPFFVVDRGYSYAAASGIVLAASLLSSVAQPAFGALTDRRSLPWLIPVATLLAGAGVAAAGPSRTYPLTLAAVAVTGVGVAAYHPESARVARLLSEGNDKAMAVFATGGNIGFALAPPLVSVSIAAGGLGWTPVLIVPAVVGGAVTLSPLRAAYVRLGGSTSPVGTTSSGREDDTASFVRLSVAIVFRSVTFVGLSTFISAYAQHRTQSGPAGGASALSLLYAGGVVGSVLGGFLVRRRSRVTVCRWSSVLTAVAVAGVVWAPGPMLYPFIALASIGLYVPFSLQITLGQDYLPSRVGTASGVTLGLAVSVGGLVSPVLGALADATSLQTALTPLMATPLVAWAMLRTIDDPSWRRTGRKAIAPVR